MIESQPRNAEPAGTGSARPIPSRRARVFLCAFIGGILLSIAGFYGALSALHATDRLTSPPVSGTWCIDSRFAWLKSTQQWKSAGFVAVGSSTTWRNLDFSVAPSPLAQTGIVNAAPCFLTTNQTRYMAEFLVEHAPTIKTLLTVVAMRDVEGCSRHQTQFFDPTLVDDYLSGRTFDWWLYFRNFRLTDIALHALYAKERKTELRYDRFGSGPLTERREDTGQPFAPDEMCYAELTQLAQTLRAKDIKFIVVTLPVMQSWAKQHDPTGVGQSAFHYSIRAALRSTGAILVDGMREWQLPDSSFTDPAHLMWRETSAFTRYVFRVASERGARLPLRRFASNIPDKLTWAPPMEAAGTADGRINIPAPTLAAMQRGPDQDIAATSPLMDAIIQNTPGYSEGFPIGVPGHYAWCRGSYTPKAVPPDDFTAVMGWGQIYPMFGTPRSEPEIVEIRHAKTYVRLKSTGNWILTQDQQSNILVGAYFVADFSPTTSSTIHLQEVARRNLTIMSPPVGHNAHFWFARRATYQAGAIDGVYVQMDMRTVSERADLVANVGADWWRNLTAPFLENFDNNPGAGMSNWIVLSPEWKTLRFYSVPTTDLYRSPPAPLVSSATVEPITRRPSLMMSPCRARAA